MEKSNSSVYIIIPCYNENSVIEQVTRDLISLDYTVVVVDDGSAQSISNQLVDTPVEVLTHPFNLGQGAALQTGMEYALKKGAKVIVHFDGDGQHNAHEIDQLIQPIVKKETDVVLGSRFLNRNLNQIPYGKRFILKLGRIFNFLTSGIWLTDAHNGFRAFSSEAASKCIILENSYAHATEILRLIKSNNLNYQECPVTVKYSSYSKKKGQSIFNSINIFFDILIGNKIP